MCSCIESVNYALSLKGGLLDTAKTKTNKEPVVQIAIKPRHIDETMTAHKLFAVYCPFCGAKYK